ncbi:DUF3955 domain-containing protein [Tepidibacter hydrothermalis]|uniref:DUF3955 domain-containing protein n=1 Tax=Tepidibacter hydrothermalis TaxID=3036126 RepID=A0ABY8EHD7_9FIRM|nr:DUF3955 domain-containing protein [Tepidibacter hydrothermalis]WFD10917.1 DUF3955 domain-containing protein [Tepidibacter hydrothermalis]
MKKNILILIPFILGLGCFISYNIIGSEVAPDGTLIEPFFLIPMSYLFMLIGIIASIVSLFCKYKNSHKSKEI